MKYGRYAVIGCNSFSGATFVARALADGADVIGFNRTVERSGIFLPYRCTPGAARYQFHQADINHDLDRIFGVLEAFRPQVVVDFAGQGMVAESWEAPEQWYQTNIVSKVRVHDRLRRHDWLERYVRISTPEVYGTHDRLREETWQYNPSTPYAVSHAAIDMSLRAFHQHYRFPVVFTRFANFYGPGQQLYRIVPRTVIYALAGRKLALHGGGTSVRGFVYGADVADGIMRAVERGTPGEIYHFSPTRFLSIRNVVEIVCERMGVSFDALTVTTAGRPGTDQAYFMDATKARNELGWSESVSFEQGVDATIDWVRRNFDEIKASPWDYVHRA